MWCAARCDLYHSLSCDASQVILNERASKRPRLEATEDSRSLAPDENLNATSGSGIGSSTLCPDPTTGSPPINHLLISGQEATRNPPDLQNIMHQSHPIVSNLNVQSRSGGGSTALSSNQISPVQPAEQLQHEASEARQQSDVNTTTATARPTTEAPATTAPAPDRPQTTQPRPPPVLPADSTNSQTEQPTPPPPVEPIVLLEQNENEKRFQNKIESNCRVSIGARCKKAGKQCVRCCSEATQKTYRAAVFLADVCVLRARNSTVTIMGGFHCVVCDPKCESTPKSVAQSGLVNMWAHAEGKDHFGAMLTHIGNPLSSDQLTVAWKAWMHSMGLETKSEATARRRALNNPSNATSTAAMPATQPLQSLLLASSQASATDRQESAPTVTPQTVSPAPQSIPAVLGSLLRNMSGLEDPAHTRA